MFNHSMFAMRTSQSWLRNARNAMQSMSLPLVPAGAVAIRLMRRTSAVIGTATAYLAHLEDTVITTRRERRTQPEDITTATGHQHDHLRQALNVILAIAQLAAAAWNASTGLGPSTREDTYPPVVPALYTFSVWAVIYAGSLVYAGYQAWPAHRQNAVLRQIGWWTAGAFGTTTVWAIASGLGWNWLTVPIIFAMFATLLGAFRGLIATRAPRTGAERYLVVLPLSIFTGYVFVATIANTAAVLTQYGIASPLGVSPTTWAIMMTLVAGLIASFITFWSRGNTGYALTVIWALIGIVVANVSQVPNTPVAVTAGSMAAVVGLTLVYTRVANTGVSVPTTNR